MKRIISLFLCLALICFAFVPLGESKAFNTVMNGTMNGFYSGMKIKVGLYYGSDAMLSANLQNVTGYGSGYRVGYYDTNRYFNQLGSLYNIEITMKPDNAFYVQLPTVFYSYDEAVAYARSVGNAHPVYADNAFFVRLGGYASQNDAFNAAMSMGGSAVYGDGVLVTDTNYGNILFSMDVSGINLGVEPIQNSYESPKTWFKTRQYEGGFEYVRNNEKLTVINVIDLENYIKGVIPYEMNKSWPAEALKAQAMAARTYTLVNLNSHKSYGFDVCNTVDCQVYRGCEDRNTNTDNAVDATRGKIITYNGEPIQAVYHASNGGATENCENVWHEELPYLRAVADDFESTTNMTHKTWSYEVTNAQLTEILRARGNDIAQIVRAYAVYTDAGNVKELHFIDANGKHLDYDGEMTRIVLRSETFGISTSSQRFIFEDKANPRVTSLAEFEKPSSSAAPTIPGAPVQSSPQRTFVLSGRYVLNLLSNQFGSGIKVLSADGISTTNSIYSMGAGGTVGATSGGGLRASSLTPPSSVSGTYIIRGSGNGHNLGMSQYGAKAMAEQGQSAEQIIKYYYAGVSVDTLY